METEVVPAELEVSPPRTGNEVDCGCEDGAVDGVFKDIEKELAGTVNEGAFVVLEPEIAVALVAAEEEPATAGNVKDKPVLEAAEDATLPAGIEALVVVVTVEN